MEPLQALQVTVLSSFHVKYNQTLEHFDAMFAGFSTKTTQCVCNISCNDCVLKGKAEIKCLSSLLPNEIC